MPCWSQTQLCPSLDRVPLVVGQWAQHFANRIQELVDYASIASKSDLECVLHHERQQTRRRLAAVNRLVKPLGDEVWDTPGMVNVYVRQQQTLDAS